MPAWIRLSAALLIVIGTAMLPRSIHPAYLAPAALLAVLWVSVRMPLGYGLRRLLVAEFFIVGIAGLSLLAPEAFPVFVSAVLKSNLCVIAIVILGWTTPFHEVIGALRRAGMPFIMVTTLALLHRYLPVLRDESRRMQRAMASRTFQKDRRLQWRRLAAVAGQLFIRSADRADRIYMAMRARGWK
jgi:cobalt/nickel transport system permease protein